jgi:glucose-1-phosphate thymidylyltransferase
MTERLQYQENTPGILLLAGNGSRLHPLTEVVNKNLLPIYDKPLCLHSLNFLEQSGISKVVVVANPRDVDVIAQLLDAHKKPTTEIFYAVQTKPLGTGDAFKSAKQFITESSFFSLWGDNIFEFALESSVSQPLWGHARLHLAIVDNPQHFGVVELDSQGKIKSIEDKPLTPKSNHICTGFMGFNSVVLDQLNSLQPNQKGEYEVMDLVRTAHRNQLLEHAFIQGSWMDAGVSFDTLVAASLLAKEKGLNKKLT